jgi:uncharacterized membrane protein YqiK
LEDIEFWVKWLTKEKDKGIEEYQAQILKLGGHVLIPYIYNIFNMEINIFPIDGHKEGLLFLLLNQREKTTPQIMRLL